MQVINLKTDASVTIIGAQDGEDPQGGFQLSI